MDLELQRQQRRYKCKLLRQPGGQRRLRYGKWSNPYKRTDNGPLFLRRRLGGKRQRTLELELRGRERRHDGNMFRQLRASGHGDARARRGRARTARQPDARPVTVGERCRGLAAT